MFGSKQDKSMESAGFEATKGAEGAVEGYLPARFLNRELSWLEFGRRVLELAGQADQLTLERARFLGILSSGLDEFFQVRVAGLKDQLASALAITSPDGLTPREQLQAIRKALLPILDDVSEIYWNKLVPELAENGVKILPITELSEECYGRLGAIFERNIFPILTPLSVDPAHPFPYVSNLSLNWAVLVRDPKDSNTRFARVKVPTNLPRLVPLGYGRYVCIEDVIGVFLERLFPGMTLCDKALFRVTRNADLVLEEGEADDLLSLVETELRRRRFGRAVRLELEENASEEVEELLVEELQLHPDDVYRQRCPLDLSFGFELYGLDLKALKASRAPMRVPDDFLRSEEPISLFVKLAKGDKLVHHPYESFSATVESFVREAAQDPDVLAIKQTLYRTSGDSTIVSSLVEAAESGKQVVVIVEVKARFDELANIGWARQLEEAGVHVVYGVVGLKTHLKAIMVVRREGDGLRRYLHLGTGNYNAKTAKTYEDFGFFTADDKFGDDLTEVFNFLTGFSRPGRLSKVIMAPSDLRARILELIEEQADKGSSGAITFKVNSLVDPEVIDALYRANAKGVVVRGIVRGLCSLRPGVRGLSERIEIKSIVGSFLEHSRIFAFGSLEDSSTKIFLGSADLMQRNLDRRVELVFPVEDMSARERIKAVLALYLADDTNSWKLGPDGSWKRIVSSRGINSQELLMVHGDFALGKVSA
jgi:polyphosphate kinase